MRSSFIATTGLKLQRSPSLRQETARRRRLMIGAVLGLAVASGVFGFVTTPRGGQDARTGPFSYFPSE